MSSGGNGPIIAATAAIADFASDAPRTATRSSARLARRNGRKPTRNAAGSATTGRIPKHRKAMGAAN